MKPYTFFYTIAAAVFLFGTAVLIPKPLVASGHVIDRFVSTPFEDGNIRTSRVGLLYTRTTDGETICQSYLLIEPIDNLTPVATVAIFVGGSGRIGLFDGGIGVRSTNFLWRVRNHFTAAGPFNIAVLDAPEPDGCTGAFSKLIDLTGKRISAGHMEDVGLAIDDLRSELGLPVWVMGTSRGTVSAANAAAVLTGTSAPDGLVLTSSLTDDSRTERNDLNDVALGDISVPALIVSHKQDACFVTPPEDAKWLAKKIRKGSDEVKMRTFNGGLPTLSSDCNALAEHGFFGIEQKVVDFISKWIVEFTP